MEVAIIGAGIAGLSCAHELEKFGVSPVIYERNSFIGEEYPYVSVFLGFTHHPVKDSINYIKEKFGIDIQPLNPMNKLVYHSPGKTAVIKGNLGYFARRGREKDALKVQIYSKLKTSKVLLSESCDYQILSKKFDNVIIANGIPAFASELGCWMQWFRGYTRGAMVLGNFEPNTLIMWVNKDYAKSGYAYLAPFDNKSASIILVLPDVTEQEADFYWESFVYAENIKYIITEEFKTEIFGGLVYPNKYGNLYFAGNAGGAADTLFGFGQLNSIIMGAMAARSIVEGKDYERLIRDIIKRNKQIYQFRKSFNNMTNAGYDTLISFIGFPGIRKLLFHSPLNIVKCGSYLIKEPNK